ncbi:hypothetical protein EYF80_012827 [Liparis tanakae]|uniref:Uncharacterized protein n=1 Tax=Liparis tanakae TaxID=230148 RepID=A0A4Z2IGY7_9TELE|nr:hypothetical protein EYF80_012827 [Liparis tanakae]
MSERTGQRGSQVQHRVECSKSDAAWAPAHPYQAIVIEEYTLAQLLLGTPSAQDCRLHECLPPRLNGAGCSGGDVDGFKRKTKRELGASEQMRLSLPI